MTTLAEPTCRVCGCTATGPCPTGHHTTVSCIPVPDPKGSPRLCHWCAGKEGAARCDIIGIGLLTGGKPIRCAFAATSKTHWRCPNGHDRHLLACRMHTNPDSDIPADCAQCDANGDVQTPVTLVSAERLYPGG